MPTLVILQQSRQLDFLEFKSFIQSFTNVPSQSRTGDLPLGGACYIHLTMRTNIKLVKTNQSCLFILNANYPKVNS